jgi:hypothetical protein
MFQRGDVGLRRQNRAYFGEISLEMALGTVICCEEGSMLPGEDVVGERRRGMPSVSGCCYILLISRREKHLLNGRMQRKNNKEKRC